MQELLEVLLLIVRIYSLIKIIKEKWKISFLKIL